MILILLIILLLLKLNGNNENFTSENTINKIVENKTIFNPVNSVNKIKNTICSGEKNCIDVVDHYKLTKLYNKDPEMFTHNNINKLLNKNYYKNI